jgi:hypothetical protein
LIKDGPGEIRYQGLGLPLTTYAKLEVDEGLFRLGSNSSIADERGFGAVPLAVLPDAIKLDGGYIGLSFSITLHANRGITVTSNGGGYAGPSQMTVPGPLSGTGTFHMVGGTVVLQNASNDTTFSGDLNLENGTLSVGGDSFLGAAPGAPDADHIKMGGVSPLAVATTGTLSFSASTTLNANRGIELTTGGTGRINIPTGGNTVTYGGNITGAGKFIKMGDGALVASGSLGHTGGTDIYGRLDVNGSLTSGPVAVKTTAAGLGANGTLAGTGTVGGAITVESGAHIAPGSGGIGELTSTAGVTLTAGSILDFDLGAPGTSDLLDVGTSTFTVDGGSVNLANAGGLASGTYTLIDYGTLAGTGIAAFLSQVPTGPAGFTYALVDTGSLINLQVTAVAANDADYNEDGVIDAADYVAWKKTPSAFGGDPAGYDLWKQQFGQASPGAGGGGAVPEPTTIGLVLIGLAALAARRRG